MFHRPPMQMILERRTPYSTMDEFLQNVPHRATNSIPLPAWNNMPSHLRNLDLVWN